jgi:hypothetical protein
MALHHTAGLRPEDPAEAEAEMRFLQDFHQRGRGWNDIGYHFVIDGAGRVYEGRPETAVGAHARGANEGNLGLSLMGRYAPDGHRLGEGQWDAIVALGRRLRRAHRIEAEALRGHRDYSATDCPGDLYPHLPALRSAIGAEEPALWLGGR